MDKNMRGRATKRQKLAKKRTMKVNRNVICNLPDVIIQHILSFLCTKDAVKTSVLSKRWKNQWMSMSNLEFEEETSDQRQIFMNFVDRVLLLNDSPELQNFSLSCEVLSDAFCIGSWILSALMRKTRNLYLRLYNIEEPLALPDCLFCCDSLSVLQLDVDIYLELPLHLHFSNLKILSLRHVVLPSDSEMLRLFSACPVLEELYLYECSWENVKVVRVSAPMLRKLIIHDNDTDEDNQGSDTDDENDMSGCKVVISGEKLDKFHCEGELRNDYYLTNASSLGQVHIELDGARSKIDMMSGGDIFRLHKFLRGLSNMKSLSLNYSAVEALNCAEELLAHLPIFSNLTVLPFASFLEVDLDSEGVLKMLQNFPRLTDLEFDGGVQLFHANEEWSLDPVPQCFSTHLKFITIWGFSSNQMLAVKKLLESATVLETIMIDFNAKYYEHEENRERREEDKEALLSFTRAPNCEMILQ